MITVILLIIIAYIDYKHKLIPDKFNLIIGFIGIINVLINFKNINLYLFSTLLVFLFFLILAMISKGGIGGGDIKLFTVLSLVFGGDIQIIIINTYIIALIVILPMLILKKHNLKSSIALAPYILLGTLKYLFF